ncbi:MAG: hypothetical protein ACI8XO_002592 [Verrucomicrobiales bacterium]|jgi:uncharacterized protein YegP (UPF0339 family)
MLQIYLIDHFRLKARNHQLILASEVYNTRVSCMDGIKSV